MKITTLSWLAFVWTLGVVTPCFPGAPASSTSPASASLGFTSLASTSRASSLLLASVAHAQEYESAPQLPAQRARVRATSPQGSQNPLDDGLGFVGDYRNTAQCRSNGSQIASALLSLSPTAVGAVVGFVVGVTAGAVTTGSISAALRAGFVSGSVGSAVGLIASKTPIGDRVRTFAENLRQLLEARDRELCGVAELGDRVRVTLVHRLGNALRTQCDLTQEDIRSMGALDYETSRVLSECAADNPRVGRIVEQHVARLRMVNQGICQAAAGVVSDYNHLVKQASLSAGTEPENLLQVDCGGRQRAEPQVAPRNRDRTRSPARGTQREDLRRIPEPDSSVLYL